MAHIVVIWAFPNFDKPKTLRNLGFLRFLLASIDQTVNLHAEERSQVIDPQLLTSQKLAS